MNKTELKKLIRECLNEMGAVGNKTLTVAELVNKLRAVPQEEKIYVMDDAGETQFSVDVKDITPGVDNEGNQCTFIVVETKY
jgi:hypothetical protein